jgi:hypothetical protein
MCWPIPNKIKFAEIKVLLRGHMVTVKDKQGEPVMNGLLCILTVTPGVKVHNLN